MARVTFLKLINIANHFLQWFSKLDTPIINTFPRMHGNPIFPLDKPCYTSRPRVDWNMIIIAYQYTIIVITCFKVSYISWYIDFSVQHQQLVTYKLTGPLIKKARQTIDFFLNHVVCYPVWLGRLTYLLREAQSHLPPFCLHSQLCKTTFALHTRKLGCHEIETNISSAYEN